jgi:hypothetical protein
VGVVPFTHCVLPHVYEEPFLHALESEIAGLNFEQKSNDLYTFLQVRAPACGR